ncbi:MAG: CDP-alcohol phosphatidyltransferase family protein, partial [Steroidobacteraceae bacterium]
MSTPADTPSPPAPKRRGVYLLPNLLTTGCLACGFFAIISAINGDFARAGAAIFLAMVFDGLDGRVARWTGTESVFGKEYDSLADMVAFGVAPALVAYQWGVAAIAEYGTSWARSGWIASF